MKLSLTLLSVIAAAQAAYVPSEPWSTLTPSQTASAGTTDHTAKFGILIKTLASASATAAAKRDVVNQIGDGQIQKQTSETLATPTVASVVNQIGDGQIQNQTAKPTVASVVNQIGDGQIQNQTKQPTPTVASVVNQIGDGQIQNQTNEPTIASVVNQIGDGQIQNQTSEPTASAVNQIGDGQVQHQTVDAASQISDGQVQATGTPEADAESGFPVACLTDNSLTMTLKGGILTDSSERVGAIVANWQFQFDGPPQAGTIYAAGWSISDDGHLVMGDSDLFYQCKSGDFYNLYYFENDSDINAQCEPVNLSIIELVSC